MARPLGVALKRLRLQVVREVREVLGAVLGDEHEVLEPAAAEALAVEAGLERHHVTGHELRDAAASEVRRLVHLEPDTVAETVEEAVLEHLARRLREHRRLAVLLEQLADEPKDLDPLHA